MMEKELVAETHAYPTFARSTSHTLIIGTFPTRINNRNFDFYYSNPDNYFWEMMDELHGGKKWKHEFDDEAKKERETFSENNGFAFTDMLASAKRLKNTSSDRDLSKESTRDILKILSDYPSISKLILTSRFAPSNPITTQQLLMEQLLGKNVSHILPRKGKGILIVGHLEFENRNIKIFVPYSTQPRVVRRFGKKRVKEMFEESLK